jgi:ribonuclease BN (tRNA processing enzyme)
MELILLGTGFPSANQKSGQADAIVANGNFYLVDAGRNVSRQIAATGFPIKDVNHVFFTHFHLDHYSGFGDFIFSRWIGGAITPFKVYGPPPIEEIVERTLNWLQYDIDLRVQEGRVYEGTRVEVQVLSPGDSLEIDGLRVSAEKATYHGNVEGLLSYRFEAEERNIVIVGDGAPTEKLLTFAKGADALLMHPCVPELFVKNARNLEQARLTIARHATAETVGQTATKAGAGTVVLSHICPVGAVDEEVGEEVSRHFDGEVIVGKDLLRI